MIGNHPASDFHLVGSEDRPKSGMWHCGPNPCWIEITHIPTQMSVRIYHEQPWKARTIAMTAMELILDEAGDDPCNFPESLKDGRP